jgi:U5 small nuclear ribonucleoprotein component
MDDSLYDEFGNYCGPELDDSEEESGDDLDFPDNEEASDAGRNYSRGNENMALVDRSSAFMETDDEMRIILHEDKKYYPEADEVYPGVRTVLLDEDAQDLSEPIIKPIKTKKFSTLEKTIPTLSYSIEFMTSLMQTPNLIRNIAVLGNFHHGKTLFLDTLVQAVQEKDWDPSKEVRYSDTRKDEQARELSVKSTPMTMVMEALSGKSYLLNILDCPGHINFCDESTAALRAVDGAVIVIDAVEGVMLMTERLIRQAVQAGVEILVVRYFTCNINLCAFYSKLL